MSFEEDEVAFISMSLNWPRWPYLPMKRKLTGQKLENATVVAGRHDDESVFLLRKNINIFSKDFIEEFRAAPVEVFKSAQALFDAGWRVD